MITVPNRACLSLRPIIVLSWVLLICWAPPILSQALTEYQIKAAFLYNFTTFTEWPSELGSTLNLCVIGEDPFGENLDGLQGREVGARQLSLHRMEDGSDLTSCQVVFVSRSAIEELSQLLEELAGKPVLTVADTPGAANEGVAINMGTQGNRVTFEINLKAVNENGLGLSSRLLNLATDVWR